MYETFQRTRHHRPKRGDDNFHGLALLLHRLMVRQGQFIATVGRIRNFGGKMNAYVYIKSEPELWTVGFYDPQGKWQPESDHQTKEAAASRVRFLNGGNPLR